MLSASGEKPHASKTDYEVMQVTFDGQGLSLLCPFYVVCDITSCVHAHYSIHVDTTLG